MTAGAAGTSSPARSRSIAVLGALVLLLWLSRMILPGELPTSLLDDSWAQCLGHALLSRLRVGVDWVFTFGPLGFFSTASYVAELFWAKLVLWEGFLGLLLAFVLAMAGAGIEHRLLRALWFAVAILSPVDPDAQAFLPIAAALAWIARGRPAKKAAIPVVALVLAALSLVKFTFAVGSFVAVASATILLLLRRERRSAVALPLAWIGSLAALWIALGQSLADVPVYVARSIQVSKGYSEAMSLPPPPVALPLSLALLLAAVVAARFHASDRSRAIETGGQIALLFLVWKAGFVRAVDHTPMFFLFVAAAPLLYDVAGRAGRLALGTSFATRLACTAFASGLLFAGGTGRDPVGRTLRHAAALLRPSAFRERAAGLVPKGAENVDLPRTREIVGGSAIDMVTNAQLLLFRNGLAWTPRPVFQSYATFSPELADLNARFFEGPTAPGYVLFHLHAIDSRLPTTEDASALLVLARGYEPVLLELDELLLRRSPRGGDRGTPETLVSGSVGFGEAIELAKMPGAAHLLRLDLRTTLAGRVANAIDSTPEIEVEIELDDGDRFRSRIVPGMVRAGFLVDPILRNQRDWIDWCEGKRVARPLRLRVLPPPRAWAFESGIAFEVARADDVAPRTRPGLATELAYSIFRTPPSAVRSGLEPSRRVLFGREVVALAADSEMSFDVTAGKHRVRGLFAASAGSATDASGAALLFTAVRSSPGEKDATLFERRVEPRGKPGDKRLFSFDTTLDLAGPATLLLRARPEPGAEGFLACWSGVGVE